MDDDGQTPKQHSPTDCQKEICQGGGVKSVSNDSEKPEEECKKCQNGSAVADLAKNDLCCGSGSNICKSGTCTPVGLTSVQAKVNGKDEDVVFFKPGGAIVNFAGSATGDNCDFDYLWDFGDGQTSTAQSPSHGYMQGGEFNVTFTVKCKKCSPMDKSVILKVTVIKIDKIKYEVGTRNGAYKDFSGTLKILFGKAVHLKAIPNPQTAVFPASEPTWEGTFGVTGFGLETSRTYSGPPSATDADTKSVRTKSGPDLPEKVLICSTVLGIHSNVEPTAGLTDGHAWISVHNYSSGTLRTYGLWPDSHATVIRDGLNGPESDVRVNFEPASGRYNRYYLVCPSQGATLGSYINTYAEWGYLNTCANWASDATKA